MLADVHTLLLVIFAISLVLGLSVGVEARNTRSAALRWWAGGLVAHGACYLLFILRGSAPDWLTIVVANTLFSSSLALLLRAVGEFAAVTLPRPFYWAPPLITGLLFWLFIDQQQVRVALSSLISFAQVLLILHLATTRLKQHGGSGRKVLVVGFSLIGGIFVMRGASVAMGIAPIQTLTTQTPLQTLTYLTGIVSLLLTSLGMVFLVKDSLEHQAQEFRYLLRSIFDSLSETLAMVDRDGTVLAVNRTGATRLQSTPQQLVGRRLLDLMPGPMGEARLAAVQRVADSGREETLVDQRAGRDYRLTIVPVEGEGRRVVISAEDITEKLAAEQALHRSEAHFRAFFERSMVGMATTSPTTGWMEVNPALCDILGYSRDELVRKTWPELTYPDDLAADLVQFKRILAGEIDEYEMDKRFIRKDGSVVFAFIAVRCIRLPDGGVDYFVALVQDISERKRYETELAENLNHQRQLNKKLEEAHNQLLQSEKMASIGQLAAGVAHELNNPIGFVYSNLGTLQNYLRDIFQIAEACEAAAVEAANPADFARINALKVEKDFDYLKTDIFQLLNESADGLERVKKIVKDLKDFSRPGESNWQWADVNQGIDSTLNIVWNELKYKCTVSKHFGELPRVRCLPSQLNQVFMNLLVNAAQSIETQGEITISTDAPTADSVRIRIADTGKGIPPENINRLFEPFFTTKPVGKGTGLGLSISWGIIQKHHGSIEVASEVGKGTTFTITLPVDPPVDADAAPAAPMASNTEKA